MTKIKLCINYIVILIPFFIYSQNNAVIDQIFNNKVKVIAKKYKEEIYFYKAQSFFVLKKWDSTLVYSMKQLSTTKNVELKDYCYYFRAISFREKILHKEAKKEFDRISDNFQFYYKVKINLGEIALEQREFETALHFFLEIEILPENQFFYKTNVLHNIGVCYLHLKKFNKAEKYLFKSARLHEVEKDSLMLIGSYMDIANLYYIQYKDNQAIPYFKKAYYLSKEIKSFELKQNATLNMAVVEENRKNFSLALTYRKEYETWKDSLNDQNKVWAIADLEKKFAVKQKQKEVNVLAAENRVKIAQRNGFLISSVLLFVMFIAGVYFYRQKIKNNKTILFQKNELDELNATKDKLFSIVSHDLRSSVNALKTSNGKLIENLENKNYSELDLLLHNNSAIANSAYNLLDNLLNWALLQTQQAYFYQESLHLASIVEQVAHNLEPLMSDKNINFKKNVATAAYVFADLDSLKIIIRNFLDNAIKFSEVNGTIHIYTHPSSEEFYHLVIEDTGLGMNNSIREELLKNTVLLSKKKNDDTIGTGLGLQLCKSMIQKNNGTLVIESEENVGTKIIIALPKFKSHG